MKKITKAMVKSFEEGIKLWDDKNEDPEMLNIYAKDRSDLTSIVQNLKEGKYREAWVEIELLDTIVRDQIPIVLYEILESEFSKSNLLVDK